eukprot:scaffold70093_cov31-Tisochrysis_lutea.AAC.1
MTALTLRSGAWRWWRVSSWHGAGAAAVPSTAGAGLRACRAMMTTCGATLARKPRESATGTKFDDAPGCLDADSTVRIVSLGERKIVNGKVPLSRPQSKLGTSQIGLSIRGIQGDCHVTIRESLLEERWLPAMRGSAIAKEDRVEAAMAWVDLQPSSITGGRRCPFATFESSVACGAGCFQLSCKPEKLLGFCGSAGA